MHIDHINISAPAELLLKVRGFYCDAPGKDPSGTGVEVNFINESA